METLAEDSAHDLLSPKVDSQGNLFFIRRPYTSNWSRPWWQTLVDVVLLPVRLLQAVFGFLNFFSMLFTGKPLMASSAGAAPPIDPGRLILWGNLVDARKAMRRAGGGDAPDLVPKSWELVRRQPNGDETVVAKGVLSFDLTPDGAVLYTNGSAVFACSPEGQIKKLANHSFIQQVVAVPAPA